MQNTLLLLLLLKFLRILKFLRKCEETLLLTITDCIAVKLLKAFQKHLKLSAGTFISLTARKRFQEPVLKAHRVQDTLFWAIL